MLCTASLYRVISLYPLLGQTWRLANYIIMRERDTHMRSRRDWREGLHHILLMHGHWHWGVMHEPQKEKESLEKYSEPKTVTEREHEGLYGGKCEVL